MAGALIQLETYGAQDIFLTGTPQITFFKAVYRRHTNFAIESIPQDFFSVVNFGSDTTCVFDKNGDLMGNVYLQIELPIVNLIKNPTYWNLSREDAKIQLENIQQYFELVYKYTSTNSDITRKLDVLLRTNNISMEDIEATMNDPSFIGCLVEQRAELRAFIATSDIFDSIRELREKKFDLIQEINQFDIQILFNSVVLKINRFGINNTIEMNNIAKRTDISRIIRTMLYPAMKRFYLKAYEPYLKKKETYQAFLDGTYVERYSSAWVEEIGHAIIDTIAIQIGSQIIDVQTGDWYILFNKIFARQYQLENYYEMIGNVPELTTLDDKIKPTYTLTIPLQFWFCRYSGLALPLVALRYHDVLLNLRLKDLSRLFYVEDAPGLLDIQNIQAMYNINLVSARLYVDYIYLDADERRRFAQASHEYLIEVVQVDRFYDIMGKQYNAHLTFANPLKYLIWFCQPNFYRQNPTGRNKCQWNNFGTRSDGTGNTIRDEFIRINSYDLTDSSQPVIYFNYVQPWAYFNHSPTNACYLDRFNRNPQTLREFGPQFRDQCPPNLPERCPDYCIPPFGRLSAIPADGYNVYSFGVKPMEQQPSGTLNASRIDDLSLDMTFTPEFTKLIKENDVGVNNGAYIGVYAMSYTILRILSGMAGLAFQTSD